MRTITRRAGAAVAAALLLASAAAAAEPNAVLDKALRDAAPRILEKLHAGKYDNVGVLKFRAARGGDPLRDPLRDDLGPINCSLADRLEVALVLAQKEDDTLGILLHASDAVSKSGNSDASHLTETGRAAFFPEKREPENRDTAIKFDRPWGNGRKVPADAFLTGEARLSADLKTVDVTVQLFDRADPATLKEVDKFTALLDWRALAEAGVSFVHRRGDDAPLPDILTENVPVVRNDDNVFLYPPPGEKSSDQKKDWGKLLSESPVKLEIYYVKDKGDVKKSAQPQAVEGGAVRPPREGEKVVLKLKNTGDHTYGVVLRINGENTIEPARSVPSDLDSLKWILEPGDEISIFGFQEGKAVAKEFEVFSPKATEEKMVNYDRDNLGTFRMAVFRAADQKSAGDTALAMRDDNLDPGVKAVRGGSLSTGGTPRTLAALQGKLKENAKAAGGRGLIGAGENIASEVKLVDFRPLPSPEATLTIHYFTPER
jgi:hypothetical protein